MGTAQISTNIATKNDLPVVCEMVHALARHHGDCSTLTVQYLEEKSGFHTIIVAKINGEIVGYTVLSPVEQLQFCAKGFDVSQLFVKSPFRGKGVGIALLQAAKKIVQNSGCQYMGISAHTNNHFATQLYLNFGFKEMPNRTLKFSLTFEEDTQQIDPQINCA